REGPTSPPVRPAGRRSPTTRSTGPTGTRGPRPRGKSRLQPDVDWPMSRLVYEGTHHMTTCTHLDHVQITNLPDSVQGCQECLATGDPWLHLRICLECGNVGCCDDSPNRHASKHAQRSGHPIIRSLEPGEEWSWCFPDD